MDTVAERLSAFGIAEEEIERQRRVTRSRG
jgi:hypothetical protein